MVEFLLWLTAERRVRLLIMDPPAGSFVKGRQGRRKSKEGIREASCACPRGLRP